MSLYAARRLGQAIPTLLGVTVFVFLILHLIPGNPAQILLFGSDASPAQVAALTRSLGLDQPLPVQYGIYLWHLLSGNLGTSYLNQESVAYEIGTRLPSTVELAGAAMGVALAVGVPAGLIAGWKVGSRIDRATMGLAVLGVAIPYFWLALLLILTFAVYLHVLPSLGVGPPQSLVLPAVALGWGFAAVVARLFRGKVAEVARSDFVLLARAKGVPELLIVRDHVLRNVAAPVVTVIALQCGNILTAAAVIEVIFGRPGVGTLLVSAIEAKNIPVVQGVVLIIAVAYVLLNLIADLVCGALDPRIRGAIAGR